MKKKLPAALAAGLALALSAVFVAPAAAHTTGTRSLAAVLTADGDTFDNNWYDYDIVTQAVLAVLAAKPDSAVGLLTDGNVALTAFLPSDRAFRTLAHDLTGKWYGSESAVFGAVATVGIDNLEAVLLYHVVPGATITSRTALQSDGAVLQTGLAGATIKVDVKRRWCVLVELKDADRNDRNAYLNPWRLDINRGNKQIAHGITEVMRPLDLP